MGGKKKSAAPVAKKESKYKIPTVFSCPDCGSKASIEVRVQRGFGRATIHCVGGCAKAARDEDDGERDVLADEEGDGRRRGRTKPKELPPKFACPLLRLEEPIDAFFKFYESSVRGRLYGAQQDDTFAALDGDGLAPQRAADDDSGDEDPGLLTEDYTEDADDNMAELGEAWN